MDGNVSNVIDKKIDDIVKKNNIYHLGKVTKINNYIIEASGLDDVFFFEKVIIGSEENIGYIEKIDESKVFISLVKTNGKITIGMPITSTGEPLQALFSKNSMGMIIDPFGMDRMSGRKFNDSVVIEIESSNIPIMDRTTVNRPLETGIAAIDLMYPIGKGQRQLIIGDKKLGKTQLCLDTIVNQRDKNVYCIYVSIGKTKKDLKRLYTKLTEKQANHYTLIVAAFNDDPAPLIKLTPYVAVSIAQYLMMEGKDVLVCIDDLKKHADACREIALISEKNTGRDAYPADIFYTHSRLLEKGCQYKNGGSITILPVMETKSGDITDYISTNIISITDGQIVLSEKLFKKGQKPAVNYGLSVSRLGGAVQRDDIKKIGSAVRRKLLSYLETADVYQLVNIESLSDELQDKLYKGQELMKLLSQKKFSPLSQDRLVEMFGYIVGLGESSTVKELLRYVEKSNEINDDSNSIAKPLKNEENKVNSNVKVENNKIATNEDLQKLSSNENTVKEEVVSLDKMKSNDSLEINFFASSNDIDDDFDKNIFNKINTDSNNLSNSNDKSAVINNSSGLSVSSVDSVKSVIESSANTSVTKPENSTSSVRISSGVSTIPTVSNESVVPAVKPVSTNGTVVPAKPVATNESVVSVKPVSTNGTVVPAKPVAVNGTVVAAKPVAVNGTVMPAKPVAVNGTVMPAKPVAVNGTVVSTNAVTSTQSVPSTNSVVSSMPVTPVVSEIQNQKK